MTGYSFVLLIIPHHSNSVVPVCDCAALLTPLFLLWFGETPAPPAPPLCQQQL